MTELSAETQTLRSVGSAPVRWVRSALAGVLLALAAVVPGVSVAAEPDTSQEGISAPEQTEDIETDSPGFDPGGETDLPFDAGPPPGSAPQDVSPDDGPLESEPTDDPEGRSAPFVEPDASAPGAPEDAPVQPLDGTQPTVPPTPATPAEPPADNGVAPGSVPAPPPPPQVLPAEPGSRAPEREMLTAVVPVEPARSEPVDPPELGPPANTGAGGGTVTSQTTDLTRPVAAPSRASDQARVHVVRPGESLWLIAEKILGPGSSATSIAAEVARLWELNRAQIPSGDPDLIAIGQQLRLR